MAQKTSAAEADPAPVPSPRARTAQGMLWFSAGAAAIIATWLLWGAGGGRFARYGPLLAIFGAAYLVVTGLEKIFGGIRAARRLEAAGVAALALVVAAGATGWAAYAHRKPYWDARKALAAGDRATDSLRAIAERHTASLQAGAAGAEALASWREAADRALPLRPVFEASLSSARVLADSTTGAERTRAEIDVRFYSLCLEWMDLYLRVRSAIEETSMVEPPTDWSESQDSIVERIQALHEPAGDGS